MYYDTPVAWQLIALALDQQKIVVSLATIARASDVKKGTHTLGTHYEWQKPS